MNDWREIKNDCEEVRRIAGPDGRALVFLRRRDGLFCYVEVKWMGPWIDEDGQQLDDGYWAVEKVSGIFQTFALAEKEASVTVMFGQPKPS